MSRDEGEIAEAPEGLVCVRWELSVLAHGVSGASSNGVAVPLVIPGVSSVMFLLNSSPKTLSPTFKTSLIGSDQSTKVSKL